MTEKLIRTKDVFWKRGKEQLRATYVFDPSQQDLYSKLPTEVIIKDRINDLNVKKGTENRCFKSDFRISTSFEITQPLQIPKDFQQEMVRLKNRNAFTFKYMTFDLTHTQTLNKESNSYQNDSYEVEVEICDFQYLMEQLHSFESFHKVILRFI